MTILCLIAALTPQRVIGKQNQLPWHLPNDLKRFKALTLHKPIIMGRKTYLSLGKPLPQRRHIIITRNEDFTAAGGEIFHDLSTALVALQNEPEVWIIGGGEIFSQMINQADYLYLTMVATEVEGDCYFPKWDNAAWQVIETIEHLRDEKHAYNYRFVTLQRIK